MDPLFFEARIKCSLSRSHHQKNIKEEVGFPQFTKISTPY